MSDEQLKNIPIMEQISASLKENGRFQQGLTPPQIKTIMQGVMATLMRESDQVEVSSSTIEVQIEGQKGLFKGQVTISSPVKATIAINCFLGNTSLATIGLEELEIDFQVGLKARAALGVAGVRKKVEEKLNNPGQALFDVLEEQLEAKGVGLTLMELHFETNNTLAVGLEGKPLQKT